MATPTSIRNKIPPITPPAIAPAFDLGSKTEKLLRYHKYHTSHNKKNLTYLGIFRAPLNWQLKYFYRASSLCYLYKQ